MKIVLGGGRKLMRLSISERIRFGLIESEFEPVKVESRTILCHGENRFGTRHREDRIPGFGKAHEPLVASGGWCR